MRFTYNDLRKVSVKNTKNYFLKRHCYYTSIEEAIKDMKKIYARIKYNIEQHEKFKDISFIIGASETNGKTALKIKVKTKGRPKYMVKGIKVRPHIHIAFYGKLAPTFARFMATKLNKNIYKDYNSYKKRKYKSKRLYTINKLKGYGNGLEYIHYIWNQSEKVLTYGNLDFENLKMDSLFLIEEQNF